MSLKNKLSILIFLITCIFTAVFFAKNTMRVSAMDEEACDECIENKGWLDCIQECWPGCPTTSGQSASMQECQNNIGAPNETCAGASGASSSDCGPLSPWDYCYASGCTKKAWKNNIGQCIYTYQYQTRKCGATDTCDGGPYLKAGRCGSGSVCDGDQYCRVGGTYKTCCEVSGGSFTGRLGGDCTGGCRTGLCPGGSSPVICGVSSCAGISAPCTTAPCGHSACQAMGTVPPPEATPVPGEPDPTPGPNCIDCASNQTRRCTPNSTDCTSLGGSVISKDNDCYCNDPNTVYCCLAQDGTCPVQMYIVEDFKPECDAVEIRVRQDPRTIHGNVDCNCAYGRLDVKIISSPPGSGIPYGYIVATVGSNSCKSWRSTYWDRSNMQAAPDPRANSMPIGPYPPGYYDLDVYYGGHAPDLDAGNICSDPQCVVADYTSLDYCPKPSWNPNEGCSEGSQPVEVYIGDQVSVNFNSMFGWTRLSGDPATMNYYQNCNFRMDRGACNSWGHCAMVQPYNNNFLMTNRDRNARNYTVRATLSGSSIVPNNEYLVSVMGTGLESIRAEHKDHGTGISVPFMRLSSGDIATANLEFTDGYCDWQEGTFKILAQDSQIDIRLGTRTVRRAAGTIPPPAAFDDLKLYRCVSPKSCTITPQSESKDHDNNHFTINFDGSNITETDIVRAWIERTDGQPVTGISDEDYIRSYTGAGKTYYEIGGCIDDGSGSCSGAAILSENWQGQDYYLHCDIPQDPDKCSGNPFCNFNSIFCNSCPGNNPECSSMGCEGWVSCSERDNACLCVNEAPNNFDLLSPPNKSPVLPDAVTLEWENLTNDDWGHVCNVDNKQYQVRVTQGIPGTCESLNFENVNQDPVFSNNTLSNSVLIPDGILEMGLTYCWAVRAHNGDVYTDSDVWEFTVGMPDAWFQAVGGNILALGRSGSGDIISYIPLFTEDYGPCILSNDCKPALITHNMQDSSGFPLTTNGVIDTHMDLGLQTRLIHIDSERDQAVDGHVIDQSVNIRLQGYDYFIREFRTSELKDLSGDGNLPTSESLSQSQTNAFYHNDLTINEDNNWNEWSQGNGTKIIVFVDGNLTIDDQDDDNNNRIISVLPGDFLAFIVSGDIIIRQSVGYTTETTGNYLQTAFALPFEINSEPAENPNIEGVFVANRSLVVESNNDPISPDKKFIGAGTFVGWTNVHLNRTFEDGLFGSAWHSHNPTETFIYRPDLLVNMPDEMKSYLQEWREIDPKWEQRIEDN